MAITGEAAPSSSLLHARQVLREVGNEKTARHVFLVRDTSLA
jgi:hypothetical protein